MDYSDRDLEAMSLARNYSRWILGEFRPFIGDVVAEVGAGTGNISMLLLEIPLKELIAIEPSQNVYSVLKQRLEYQPRVRVFRAFFKGIHKQLYEQLDTVLYISVLEHIADDTEELSYAYKSLKNGGHLCIFVPALSCLRSKYHAALGHYRRYNIKGLKDLVKAAGFDVVKARYFDIAGIIPWYIVFVLMGRGLRAGQAKWYDKLVVPIMRVIEKVIPAPVGKNILIVGRKWGRSKVTEEWSQTPYS